MEFGRYSKSDGCKPALEVTSEARGALSRGRSEGEPVACDLHSVIAERRGSMMGGCVATDELVLVMEAEAVPAEVDVEGGSGT